jgi:putative phosphonate metabolism protein
MRFALYYAPPEDHPLWQAGCEWLGRDPGAGRAFGRAPAFARAPWRYGFHATLKPPMRIKPPYREADLLQAARALAQRHRPFTLPALQVDTLAGFVALRPVQPLDLTHPLQCLADDCVQQLDPFRAPPAAAEIARRESQPMSDEQRALLARWGYAHVLSQWRFHMTLTDTLTDDRQRQTLVQRARAHFAPALGTPPACDALCVFVEPAAGEPFVLAHRLPLGTGG